jgi:hypothetical protein
MRDQLFQRYVTDNLFAEAFGRVFFPSDPPQLYTLDQLHEAADWIEGK